MRSWPLLAALLAVSCADDPTQPRGEFLPQMVDSVPYDAFSQNPNTRDGKTLMAPPPGSVPRGELPLHYGATPEEALRAGRELVNEVEPTADALARGEAAFASFCRPCHGVTGEADGPVIPKFPMPPNLKGQRAKELPDGHLFHIITYGQGLMPSHAVQVRPIDRWKIIHHIRKLQGKAPAAEPGPAAVKEGVTP